MTQLTGFSDPVYAEAYVHVNQYDIVLDVLVVNQTSDTLQNCTLELATLGQSCLFFYLTGQISFSSLVVLPWAGLWTFVVFSGIKLSFSTLQGTSSWLKNLHLLRWPLMILQTLRLMSRLLLLRMALYLATLVRELFVFYLASLKHDDSSHVMFALCVYFFWVFDSFFPVYDVSGAASDRNCVVLSDIHIDIMDYIQPASCTDAEFRQMWAEFEWENKVNKLFLSTLLQHFQNLLAFKKLFSTRYSLLSHVLSCISSLVEGLYLYLFFFLNSL